MQLSGMIQGRQLQRLAALFLIIISGLMLRRFGYSVDLPFVFVKYGGSLLWGAMVYFLLACWFPRRTEPVRRIISIEN